MADIKCKPKGLWGERPCSLLSKHWDAPGERYSRSGFCLGLRGWWWESLGNLKEGLREPNEIESSCNYWIRPRVLLFLSQKTKKDNQDEHSWQSQQPAISGALGARPEQHLALPQPSWLTREVLCLPNMQNTDDFSKWIIHSKLPTKSTLPFIQWGGCEEGN